MTAKMLRRLGLPVLFALLTVALVRPVHAGGGVEVNPTQPTFPNNALFHEPGFLQLETNYFASVFEGPVPTLHTLELVTLLTVGDLIETRLRWDLVNVAGSESGLGDLALGLKGGFYGRWNESISLAVVGEIRFPSGAEAFSIGSGVTAYAGFVATQIWEVFQFDLQAGPQTHIFTEEPGLGLPVGFATTWRPIGDFKVLGDFVLGLDLLNLSESQTSLMAGVGYELAQVVSFDASVRLGLSSVLPDVTTSIGVTWLVGKVF